MRKLNKIVLVALMAGVLTIPTACGNSSSNTAKSTASTTSVKSTTTASNTASTGSTTSTTGSTGSTQTSTANAEIKTMSGSELQAIEDDKDSKEEYLVIDVRPEEEYKAGHLAHAINMPIDTFKDNLGKIAGRKEKAIVVYCNSGKKSGEAANILVENGYTDVYNADGVKNFDYKLVTYGNITAEELFAKKDEAFIVDMREAADYDAGHFDKAVNGSVDDLSALDSKLPADKDTLIITHCYSGNRSAKAAEHIAGLGYTNVWNTIDGAKEVDYPF